jgi:hypothetical protein
MGTTNLTAQTEEHITQIQVLRQGYTKVGYLLIPEFNYYSQSNLMGISYFEQEF